METAVGGTLGQGNNRQEARRPIDIDFDSSIDDRLRIMRQRFPVRYQLGDVQEINRRFIEILEEIRVVVQRQGEQLERLPDAAANDYWERLREVGADAYAYLPEAGNVYIQRLEAEAGERGISLDFTFTPGMNFLWEIVYTGDIDAPQREITSGRVANGHYPIDDLFWGLRYPLGHLYWDYDFKEQIRFQQGILATAHEQLLHSNGELAWLRQKVTELKAFFGVNFVFHKLEEAVLAEGFSDEKVWELFYGQQFRYGIVHFACHCVHQAEADVNQAYLSFTAHDNELNLGVGKFNRQARQKRCFQQAPFVFLNACETATPLHMLQSLDLPQILLKFGAGGVIATACTMPDNFASAFAREFYRRLLERPLVNRYAYIGEVLLETRRHFVEVYNNPLGLGYGHYALSNQQLRLSM